MSEEILLTEELYKSIIDQKVKELIELKQNQGETLSKISIEKETLKELRCRLKQIKKDIKISKKNLNKSKWDLSKINETLRLQYDVIKNLNDDFISEEDIYLDSSSYSNELINNKKQKFK